MIETPLIKELTKPLRANGKEFLEAIFENSRRRDTCDTHVFIELELDSFTHTYKYQCGRCGYVCDHAYRSAYELGLKHGGGKIE